MHGFQIPSPHFALHSLALSKIILKQCFKNKKTRFLQNKFFWKHVCLHYLCVICNTIVIKCHKRYRIILKIIFLEWSFVLKNVTIHATSQKPHIQFLSKIFPLKVWKTRGSELMCQLQNKLWLLKPTCNHNRKQNGVLIMLVHSYMTPCN